MDTLEIVIEAACDLSYEPHKLTGIRAILFEKDENNICSVKDIFEMPFENCTLLEAAKNLASHMRKVRKYESSFVCRVSGQVIPLTQPKLGEFILVALTENVISQRTGLSFTGHLPTIVRRRRDEAGGQDTQS